MKLLSFKESALRANYSPAIGKAMREKALAAAADYKKLSCTEGGAFDAKHKDVLPTTAWGRLSQARAKSGVSRKARINTRKEA